MPRTRKAAEAIPVAKATLEAAPTITLSAEQAPPSEAGGETINSREPRQSARGAAATEPAYAADPHEKISVSLSNVRGGPEMHLLRSHRFRQLQIRFDREQPDDKYLEMLRKAGWRDRTQEEGVWTKQIDPNARWQSVAKMEQEFKAVANAIRECKKLAPVLEGLGA
jgi:hypothetical protein